MSEKKFKYLPFVTEVMTARSPSLTEPDTKGIYSDGKYKTEAIATAAFTLAFQETIQAYANEMLSEKPGVNFPWKETKEGHIAFMFKSPKKKPELVDAKGAPLVPGIVIRDGALIRLAGVIAAWEKGTKRGVSLWPDAVRVIKLAEGFDPLAAFGGPEDGFDVSTLFQENS